MCNLSKTEGRKKQKQEVACEYSMLSNILRFYFLFFLELDLNELTEALLHDAALAFFHEWGERRFILAMETVLCYRGLTGQFMQSTTRPV